MSTRTVITDLVQTLEDSRKGFADAATRLAEDGNAQLARRFEDFSEQRARLSAELRSFASAKGMSIDEDGSLAGALHRGWIGLKDALTGEDADAIVEAARRGEEHAVQEFEKAIGSDDLPEELEGTVRAQLSTIEETRDTVSSMSS